MLAIKIIKSVKSMWAPLYLGTLYTKLDDYVHNFTKSVGHYDAVTHLDFSFL